MGFRQMSHFPELRLAGETLPLPFVLPCVFTAFAAETLPLPCVFH